MIMVVAVTLSSMMVLLCLLTWGLIRECSKKGATLIIESKAVATLFNWFIHVEYRPPGQAIQAPESVDQSPSVELLAESSDDASGHGAEFRRGGDADGMAT